MSTASTLLDDLQKHFEEVVSSKQTRINDLERDLAALQALLEHAASSPSNAPTPMDEDVHQTEVRPGPSSATLARREPRTTVLMRTLRAQKYDDLDEALARLFNGAPFDLWASECENPTVRELYETAQQGGKHVRLAWHAETDVFQRVPTEAGITSALALLSHSLAESGLEDTTAQAFFFCIHLLRMYK